MRPNKCLTRLGSSAGARLCEPVRIPCSSPHKNPYTVTPPCALGSSCGEIHRSFGRTPHASSLASVILLMSFSLMPKDHA